MNKKNLIIVILATFTILSILLFLIISKNKENIVANTENRDTLPYMLQEKCEILEQDTSKGMTIKDSYSNEWVWITVPKTEVFKNTKNKEDYANIEKDIKQYTAEYFDREYIDNIEEFKEYKEKVLQSIYEYGGFWISRYEIGTDDLRKSNESMKTEPLSQQGKFVYNYVTFDEAKELSSQISNAEYESGLLFGFQWDLVCKFIEKNGYILNEEKITKAMINSNSSKWGNYYPSEFIINTGKYSIDYGESYIDSKENEIKKIYKNYILTTGASEQNKTCNIYDFAGNVSEWNIEVKREEDKLLNTIRDGNFYFNYGGNDPVSGRYSLSAEANNVNYGFRIGCIK